MMVRQEALTRPNPFHRFICDSCGNPLGRHFVFRPDNFSDARGGRATGKLYCHRDQVGWAGSYHQRELARTMEEGYSNG